MPYTTVVAGTTITAAWANANVRDQVITPFASAAARTSAVTSPVEGMYAHLNDTNMLTHYNGSAWVPATSNTIASMTPKTVDSSVFSVDSTSDFSIANVPVRSDRLYTINMHSGVELSSGSRWIIAFYVDGTITERLDDLTSAGAYNGHVSAHAQWRPTTGTKNIDVRVDFVSGGTLTFKADATSTRQLWVDDMGPR